MTSEKNSKILKELRGVVVSNAMDKTAVVSVTTFKTHPKYKKKYKSSKKYKVHDEKNVCEVGEEVRFVSSKPMSKNKTFVLVSE